MLIILVVSLILLVVIIRSVNPGRARSSSEGCGGLIERRFGGIYVPPAADSHPMCDGRKTPEGRWTCCRDNNLPGLLHDPRGGAMQGETLGLENHPTLSLSDPIRTPLLDPSYTPISDPNRPPQCKVPPAAPTSEAQKSCMEDAIRTSQTPTLTAEGYYRQRYQQCNPYGGSYCQCTNNYIPLPTAGYCQPYSRLMETCPYPYKVAPAMLYRKAMKCMSGDV